MEKNKLELHTKEVQNIIYTYAPAEEGFQKTIFTAMNYSFQAGGKRLRPLLMQETYRLFGGTGKVVEPFMAAIEMIHTYSLIHDDLPALDNDEYRRGRKTSHVVFGEAMAILAGDALLNYAFETACKAFELEPGDQTVARAFTILAKKAGVNGMIGGQVVDVKCTGQSISGDTLDFIYRLKTGALIEGSMMIGAILAGASKEEIKSVETIAQKVGLAFQIQDDILDETATFEELGKPIHSDEECGKVTYVTIHGIDESGKEVSRLSNEAIAMLESMGEDAEFLVELTRSLIHRTK